MTGPLAHPLQFRRFVSASPPLLRRVLVAEDDEEMRTLVSDVLRRAGFHVEEVSDGRQMWIRTIQAKPYDLVISDVRLPVVDGLTVLEDLHDRAPTTALILMTAFGDHEVRARAERLGAVFLDKPFQLNQLSGAVRSIYGESTPGGTR